MKVKEETDTESPGVEAVSTADLDPRVWVFRCESIVDSYAVITERFVVLIDTLISPDMAGQVMAYLGAQALRDRTLLVVNTHGDWDHCWGNALFDGLGSRFPAPIIGHRNTRRFFDSQAAESLLAQSREASPGWYEDVEIRLPTLELKHEMAIHGGDVTVRLIPTPGHTADHLSVWIPELTLLIAGDAAEMPIPFLDERSSVSGLRQSLRLMRDLEPTMVLYSHGAGMVSPDLIDHNIWYFEEAERRCLALLNENPHLEFASLPDHLDWPLDAVMPEGQKVEDKDTRRFYEQSHRQATIAMGRWLSSPLRLQRSGRQ